MANKLSKELSGKNKRLLSLAKTLADLKPHQRVIILDHLDLKTCDDIYYIISKVLNCEHFPKYKCNKLKHKLSSYSNDLAYVMDKSKNPKRRKKILTQLGGGVLPLILNAALPLLLNLFPK